MQDIRSLRSTSRRALLAASLAGAASTLALLPQAASAQSWPERPVTLVVGFSPGSSIDMVARVIAQRLGDKLGQPVVVDNKSGAGGNLAAGQIAAAAPDGYKLLVVANSIAISPAVYPNLKFDTQKDLKAIAYVGIGPVILKVNQQRGFQSVADLVKYAKAHPGTLNFGSSGVGGTPYMATVLFDSIAGIKMTHIPYKGGSEALRALVGGQVDVLINPLLGDAASDKVKSLAISGQQRSSLAPGVPTFAEAGYPGYDMGVYYGVMGPAGMPADVVRKLNVAINQVLVDPAVVDALTVRSGIVLKPGSSEAFQSMLEADIGQWMKLVRDDRSIVE